MASSVKSGFSTINRLLGKRSKDDGPAVPQGTLTSSSSGSPSSMFSQSMHNLDSSHHQYNKIVPLAAMTNAPFEQTFRITVALPRDQLFVVRVGAKMRLHQILDMTCTAKQLDREKYEFRHPADNSMVFSNDCTIGEVGLNEIRLVPMSETRLASNNFSSAELARMKAGSRNSFAAPTTTTSSNDNSLRYGHVTKSQYSSTNSLNSQDSANGQPVAPLRKKRAAPRPPPQNVIPEDSPIRHMSFHVSSPNLAQNLSLTGAEEVTPQKMNGGMRPVSMFHDSSNGLAIQSLSRTSSNGSESTPSQIPRKNKKSAPAPPPRSARDSTPPVPIPRTVTPVPMERHEQKQNNENVSKTMLNAEAATIPVKAIVHAEEPKEVPSATQLVTEAAITNSKPVPDILPTDEVQPRQRPVAIVKSNKTPTIESLAPASTDSPDEEDEGNHMNIYNLNTGKCVQAEVGPEEMNLDAIQGILLLDQINEEASKIPTSVTEDLYAEIRKPPKKSPEPAKEDVKADDDKEQRAESPEWTYTLPAPTHFADGSSHMLGKGATNHTHPETAAVPTETFNGNNVYYNYSENGDGESIAARSMTTTVVSDMLITPVIKERIPLDQPLMLPLENDHFHNNHSESSDFNSSSTLTSVSPNGRNEEDEERRKKLIINSDMEDGYHGQREPTDQMLVNKGLIATLEKRREKFIENELEQLVTAESVQENEQVVDDMELEESLSQDTILLLEAQARSKATVIAPENEEPTISRSPIEDGLPSGIGFLNQSTIDSDSGKDSTLFNSTGNDINEFTSSGEDSKNESLETDHSLSHINVSNQSFEQRRSSFLADMEQSKNLFNRRTSQELSISESPSQLQSLQVMRKILMSTGKVKEVEKVEEKVEELPAREEPKQITVVEVPQAPPEKIIEAVPEPVVEPAHVAKPAASWKYTGPPKINLGSWSERPKVQVCLKTDSDYHHSLQKAAAAAAEQKNQSSSPVKLENGATKDQIIPDNTQKLPVVRAMELKKTASVPEDTSVMEPVTTRNTETLDPVVKAKIQRPVSMHSTRYTPTVRGFLSNIKDRDDSGDIRSTKINPVLMRSDSNVVAKANGGIAVKPEGTTVTKDVVVKSPPPTTEKPVMFSQSTLRRTGLKDRILSSPPETVVEVEKVKETPTIKMPLKSILVERSTVKEVISSPVSPPPPPPPPMTAKTPGSLLNPLARLSAPDTAQKPIVRGMVKKTITPEVDPRQQLLDSIRNFSFNNQKN